MACQHALEVLLSSRCSSLVVYGLPFGRGGGSTKATATATLPKTLAASNLEKQTVADYLQTMLYTHVVVQVGKPGLKKK